MRFVPRVSPSIIPASESHSMSIKPKWPLSSVVGGILNAQQDVVEFLFFRFFKNDCNLRFYRVKYLGVHNHGLMYWSGRRVVSLVFLIYSLESILS